MSSEGFAFHAWHRLNWPMVRRQWTENDIEQCRCVCQRRWREGMR